MTVTSVKDIFNILQSNLQDAIAAYQIFQAGNELPSNASIEGAPARCVNIIQLSLVSSTVMALNRLHDRHGRDRLSLGKLIEGVKADHSRIAGDARAWMAPDTARQRIANAVDRYDGLISHEPGKQWLCSLRAHRNNYISHLLDKVPKNQAKFAYLEPLLDETAAIMEILELTLTGNLKNSRTKQIYAEWAQSFWDSLCRGCAASVSSPTRSRHLTIRPDGDLELSAALLGAAGFAAADTVIAEAENGAIRLRSLNRAVADLQAFVRSFVTADVSLVDELIAERRREAERE